MSLRLSKLYGMDIFTDGGRFLGRVQDLVVDLESGEVVRISLDALQGVSKDEAKRILRERAVMYKSVKSVGDVIVVSKEGRGGVGVAQEKEIVEEGTRPSWGR